MARSDYAHYNEEADLVWWLEEGRHGSHDEPYDEYDTPDGDWEDFEDEDDEPGEDGRYWQAEDAGMEAALFGDC